MNELVSVIVPVYKTEKYLCRCVDSILAQTYTNLEIILVDDGSPDNCGKICDEYAAKDSRIKVIHKENGGVSSARNAGLKSFTGEYVTFIDSDDFVDNRYVECLIENMDDSTDIVVCSYNALKPDLGLIENFLDYSNTIISRIDNGFDFMGKSVNYGILCKLFKKETLTGLFFDEKICSGEDALFCAQAYVKVRTIKYVPESLYSYIYYDESLSHGAVTKDTLILLDVWDDIHKLFPEDSISHKTCALEYILQCFGIYGRALLSEPKNNSLVDYIYSVVCSERTETIYKSALKTIKIRVKYYLLIHCKSVYNLLFLMKKKAQF